LIDGSHCTECFRPLYVLVFQGISLRNKQQKGGNDASHMRKIIAIRQFWSSFCRSWK
jgi:hypothetical protein